MRYTAEQPAGQETTTALFHGADDTVVPPSQSLGMVKAIRDAGGDIQYTEFPDTGHNSWDKAYQDKDAIAWLLRQQRKQSGRNSEPAHVKRPLSPLSSS